MCYTLKNTDTVLRCGKMLRLKQRSKSLIVTSLKSNVRVKLMMCKTDQIVVNIVFFYTCIWSWCVVETSLTSLIALKAVCHSCNNSDT